MDLNLKNILILFFIIFTTRVFTVGANEASIFVFDDVLICPIGWKSQEEIQIARNDLIINIKESVIIKHNKHILLAPINGKVMETGSFLILENDNYKIIYPVTLGHPVLDQVFVNIGDPILFLNKCENNSLITFLRSSESPYKHVKFQNGRFRAKVHKPEKIFAMSSGRVFLFPVLKGTMKRVSIINGIDATYLGVGNLLVEDRSYISITEQIGSSGNGLNNNFFELQITAGLGSLNPHIIYIEVLEK